MDDIKVDKGVPMPEATPLKRKLPFEQLEVGDSFLYSTKTGRKVQGAARGICRKWSDKLGTTYATRRTEEGIRIWRLS